MRLGSLMRRTALDWTLSRRQREDSLNFKHLIQLGPDECLSITVANGANKSSQFVVRFFFNQ